MRVYSRYVGSAAVTYLSCGITYLTLVWVSPDTHGFLAFLVVFGERAAVIWTTLRCFMSVRVGHRAKHRRVTALSIVSLQEHKTLPLLLEPTRCANSSRLASRGTAVFPTRQGFLQRHPYQ